jgi:hypothetical protein
VKVGTARVCASSSSRRNCRSLLSFDQPLGHPSQEQVAGVAHFMREREQGRLERPA